MQRRITWPVAAAVGGVLLAGIAVGATMVSRAPASGRTASDPQIVSRWSGGDYRLVSGSLGADPGRGFVRLRIQGAKPIFYETPEGAGALRLVSHTGNPWQLRSSSGALVLLSPYLNAKSVEFLGQRLNPAQLGPIGPRGIAVPTYWWASKRARHPREAVVLFKQTPGRHGGFANGWKVYGYLPGFSTRRVAAEWKAHFPRRESVDELHEPLLGPDGESYAIDAKERRLVPIGHSPPETLEGYKLGGCTTWPGSGGTSYRACAGFIVRRSADGATATILRRSKYDGENNAWTFLQPSPDGRWFLLEEATEACSVATWAEFLPARGGSLSRVFPGSITSSEALGWLPDNTALVAGQPQACGGNGPDGIYEIRPDAASSPPAYQLVYATSRDVDATTWGYWHQR